MLGIWLLHSRKKILIYSCGSIAHAFQNVVHRHHYGAEDALRNIPMHIYTFVHTYKYMIMHVAWKKYESYMLDI